MNTELHTYTLVDSSLYQLTGKCGEKYITVRVKNNGHNHKIFHERLWKWKTPKGKYFTFQISANQQKLMLKFPNQRVYIMSVAQIRPTSEETIKFLKKKDDKRIQGKHLREVLEEAGFKFEILFCKYREDSDYMTVYKDSKPIFNGTTDDLVE